MLNERRVEKFAILSQQAYGWVRPVVCHPLMSVKETSLLGDFVRTELSNMHRCCAFPFALAGLFLFLLQLLISHQQYFSSYSISYYLFPIWSKVEGQVSLSMQKVNNCSRLLKKATARCIWQPTNLQVRYCIIGPMKQQQLFLA